MGDFVSFVHLVHEAFSHLNDRAYLREHPLTAVLFGDTPQAVERLHRMLIDSIQWLRPLGAENYRHAEWRRYKHLQLRYVEGMSTEEIARELAVSARQARRDHAEALDELARLLWQRCNPILPVAPAPESPVHRPAPTPTDGLDSELSKLVASDGTTLSQIDEILQGVIETTQQLASDNRVAVIFAAVLDQPYVETSRTVLRQILLSLLVDAIVQHPDSVLEIEVARSPEAVDVVLRLVGRGNNQNDLISSDCFDLAERLAKSQNIIIYHLKSSGASGGLAVLLRLLAPSERTILLVDDNPDVALLFRRFLADTSYRLLQARSAERALKLAREVRPDVVVLDILLPTKDGWEILQALRADPTSAGVPIIISSVVPDHALARSLGVIDFLPKPVTRATLLAALSQVRRNGPAAPVGAPREASG